MRSRGDFEMSATTDAIFVYGFELQSQAEGETEDIRLVDVFGIESDEDRSTDDIFDSKKWGVDVIWHCSSECAMFILAVNDFNITAHRGYPEKLGREFMAIAEWNIRIRNFCEFFKIEYEEPEFILCSYQE